MSLQLLVIVAFAVGAGIFVVVASVTLLINKSVEIRETGRAQKLYAVYSELCVGLMLRPFDNGTQESDPAARVDFYRTIARPLQHKLRRMSSGVRAMHLRIIQRVLLDLAKDVAGETSERLNFFFYVLGIVDHELDRLRDRRWWFRAAAAKELGLTGAKRAIGPLIEALDDDHPTVRYQVMNALVSIVGVEALRTILERLTTLTDWNAVELSIFVMKFQDAAVPYLLEALGSRSTAVVVFSIEMLAEIGFVNAVEPLRGVAQSYPNVIVRAKAMEALGRLGDSRAEALLVREINNPIPDVRRGAIGALARIGAPSAVPQLRDRFLRVALDEKLLIARAIAASGGRGVQVLQTLSVSDAPEEAGIARQVLEEFGW